MAGSRAGWLAAAAMQTRSLVAKQSSGACMEACMRSKMLGIDAGTVWDARQPWERPAHHGRFQPSLLLALPGRNGDGLACVAGAVALL